MTAIECMLAALLGLVVDVDAALKVDVDVVVMLRWWRCD
jgi:hypothetical protein